MDLMTFFRTDEEFQSYDVSLLPITTQVHVWWAKNMAIWQGDKSPALCGPNGFCPVLLLVQLMESYENMNHNRITGVEWGS